MANRTTVTTTRSWVSRILGSFQGIIVGIVLFLLAFVVLWQNEGRTDLSTIADDSVAVSAAAVDGANEGKLVAAAGTVTADAPLGDPDYLRPGAYLALHRDVQMYAWVEHADSTTTKNTGGSETTTTEYSYAKEWVSRPADSSNFQIPGGHSNPSLTIPEADFTAPAAHVGVFAVEPNRLGLPGTEAVTLTPDALVEGTKGKVENNYLFTGRGSLQSPIVGDVRIQFTAVPANINVTVFGKQQGSSLIPYVRGNDTLYTAFRGDRDSAIAAMHSSYQTMGWVLRLIGFLMMWGGLTMITGPISTFLDVLPFLGNLSRTAISIVAFGIAAVLSLITIVISALVHNPIALLLLLLFIGGIGWLLYQRRRPTTPHPTVA